MNNFSTTFLGYIESMYFYLRSKHMYIIVSQGKARQGLHGWFVGENERELSLGPDEVSMAILTKSLRDNASAIKTL